MKIAAVILNLDLTMDLTMDLNEVHLLDLTLVIINRRSAAVKICRKFHESNFENVRDLYFDTLLNRSNFHQSRRNKLINGQRVW